MGQGARKLDIHATTYIASGRPISPRVRNAIRLYASGAVKTKREAAAVAGLGKSTFFDLRANPLVNAQIARITQQIDDNTVDMSAALLRLGRAGVAKVAELMETAKKEEVQLKAAQDLADRSPETSKVHKVALEADVTLPASTVNDLVKALLEQASRKERYIEAAEGDYIKVNEVQPLLALPQENK